MYYFSTNIFTIHLDLLLPLNRRCRTDNTPQSTLWRPLVRFSTFTIYPGAFNPGLRIWAPQIMKHVLDPGGRPDCNTHQTDPQHLKRVLASVPTIISSSSPTISSRRHSPSGANPQGYLSTAPFNSPTRRRSMSPCKRRRKIDGLPEFLSFAYFSRRDLMHRVHL